MLKIIDKENSFKISLCYKYTLNDPYEKEKNEQKDNPISNLFSSFDEIKYIIENNNKYLNLFKFIYFNSTKINSILYDSEEMIHLNSTDIKNDISNYFYLALLLESDQTIVNYEYSFDIIKNIDKQLKNKENKDNNIFKQMVTSKLLIDLIENYRRLEQEDEQYKEQLDTIEEKAIKINEECIKKLGLEEKKIKTNNKIDQIYAEIINKIIQKVQIEKDLNTVEQMDLSNINITKNIFDKLINELDIVKNKDINEKYIIKDIKDLTNEETINFYYILFKYILKSSHYIYQIPLILESRKAILKIINSSKDFLNDLDNINNKDKLKYNLDFITDSKFYHNKYDIRKNGKNNTNSQISPLSTKYNSLKKSVKQSISIEIDEEDYKILKLEKIIRNKKKKYKKDKIYIKDISIDFIKEMSNGFFIFSGLEDILYIYNKDFVLKNDIIFELPLNEQQLLPTQQNSNMVKTLKFKNTQNIIETNESISKRYLNKPTLDLIDCSKYGLSFYTLDCLNSSRNKNTAQIDISCNGCFEINGQYIIYGEKGIYHFDNIPSGSAQDFNNLNIDKTNYKGGIKINENILSLTSNQILPNGKDIIIFYDVEKKQNVKQLENISCVVGINGITLLEIEEKYILLYACKKYISSQKNGIFLIELDVCKKYVSSKKNSTFLIEPDFKGKEQIKGKFFETEDFEVNCFCPISIKDKKTSNYFFVGGFDKGKRIGLIKLYKFVIKKEIEIEFIDDLDFEEDNISFGGTINCIVQSKHNGKILVSCWNKKVYVFSKPNLDFYLKEDEYEKQHLLN